MTTSLRHLASVTVAIAFLSPVADAYEFTPTDLEWQNWPDFCKAKYVWNQVGKRSRFANQVSAAQKQQLVPWEAAGIRGVHHYCTGTIWLHRAWRERDPLEKERKLRRARNETVFTFNGSSNKSAPQFGYVAIQMATIAYEQGESEYALQILDSVTEVQPKSDMLYSATAVMQKRLGRLDDARDTLLRGVEELDGGSAEINYNLGLIYLELGDVDDAVKHAKLAYESGFPLPGLRTKLKKLGRM